MTGEPILTIIGNLTADPELRYTPNGVAVARFTVASTPRTYRDGEWRDGQPLFMNCTIWRQPAENVAESLTRGARVIVTGRLSQRSYETKTGERRTAIEMTVDEVGPSLRWAQARISRMERTTTGGAAEADPWATATPAQSDEPPF